MSAPSFSFSKISSYENCPRSYEFRYLLGENERFSTIERHMGSAVHETLRHLYAERAEGREPSPEVAAERYEAAWASPGLGASIVVKSGRSAEDYRADGREMVRRYAGGRFVEDASETLELERRFRVELDGGIRFNGIIDRVARPPGGTVRIIDYKTGNRVPDPRTDPQLSYYAIWVMDEAGVDEVELAYEDLRRGQPLTAHLRRNDLPGHVEVLLASIRSILAASEFPARPSVLCRWCGFNPICDAVEPSMRVDPDAARTHATASISGHECPECGSSLRERDGRFGRFIGCSRYPRCRYTRNEW